MVIIELIRKNHDKLDEVLYSTVCEMDDASEINLSVSRAIKAINSNLEIRITENITIDVDKIIKNIISNAITLTQTRS